MSELNIKRALRILTNMFNYWNTGESHSAILIASTYEHAIEILQAAMADDTATLDRYDYHKGVE